MFKRIISIGALAFAMNASAGTDNTDYLNLSLNDLMKVKVKAASLFEESRVEAAASIDKITAKDWEQWSARTNADAFQSIPSIHVYPSFFGSSAIAIRGYAQNLSARGIATLIDGIPVNEFIFGSAQYERERISLGVVDSIEIIKGPGSTLYGSDAFHGSLQFNSFYSDKTQSSVNAQTGSFDYRQANTKLSHVFTDQMIVNVAADHREQGVWNWPYINRNTNLPDSRANQYETDSVNVKIHNTAQDDWHYQVQWHYNKFDGDGFVAGGFTGYFDKDNSASKNNFNLWDGLLEHNIAENIKLGVRANQWQVERHNLYEVKSGRKGNDHEISKDSFNIFSSYENETGSRLLVGLEQSEQVIDRADFNQFTQSGVQISSNKQLEDGAVRKIKSIYSQGRWVTPLSGLELEAGLRSDNYAEFGRQNSPRLAFIYSYDEQHTAKLIYGNAFRAPVTAEVFGSAAIRGSPSIKPETLDSYEAIWMVTHKKTAYQITAFYNHWQNGIITVPIVDPVYQLEFKNIGENHSQGIELAYKVEFNDILLQADIVRVNSRNDTNEIDFNAFPVWSAHMTIGKELNKAQTINLRFSDDFDWAASTSNNAKNLPANVRVDLAYAYKVNNNIQLSTTLSNLFDRKNYVPSLWGNPEGERLMGRVLDVNIRIMF